MRFRFFRDKPEQRSGLAYPDAWMFDAFGGAPASSGKRVTVAKAMGLAPVWSAVSIISQQLGQLPLKVYRDLGEGDRTEARTHRMWSVLHDKPNSYTPADRFWSAVAGQLLLYGNAFVLKDRDLNGLVDELWLLKPGAMTIEWNPRSRVKRYLYDPGDGPREVFDDSGVLHLFDLSLDGVCGESVITSARNAFGTAIARDEFEGGFYQRGAVLSGVVEHPGQIGVEGADNLKRSFTSIYGGSDRAHQVGVLEEGATFRTMSHPLKDLEFVANQQLSRTDIALMFKLPPSYLGGSSGDSLTYATVEGNQIHFALHSISPLANTIAKGLSTDVDLFPQSNTFNAEFTLQALMRGDSKSRSEYYKVLHEIRDDDGKRAMDVDEIRERENFPPAVAPPKPALPLLPPQPNGPVPEETEVP